MRRVVHKFRGDVPGFDLDLPDGSLILKVADQLGAGQTLDVWAEVPATDEGQAVVRRSVKVVPTGVEFEHTLLVGYGHFDTVVTAGGSLVWHVYLDADGEKWVVPPQVGGSV